MRSPFKYENKTKGTAAPESTFNILLGLTQLVIPKESLDLKSNKPVQINLCVRRLTTKDNTKEVYLIIHIFQDKKHYFCGFNLKKYNINLNEIGFTARVLSDS